MAEEKDEVTETPQATPPVEEQTPEVETPEPAEKPEQTPEAETEAEVEETQPEVEVEKQVPLAELQKERERRRQAEEALFRSRQPQTPAPPTPELDPEVVPAVQNLVRSEAAVMLEQSKTADFQRKHATELADPVLSGTTQRLIAEANAKNEYLDQEEALDQAKKLLDERLKPEVKKAKEESFEEGQEKAKEKGKAGVVGSSGPRPEVDESKMTSEEYAKYHNIPRAN